MGEVISQRNVLVSGEPFSVGFPLATMKDMFRLGPRQFKVRGTVSRTTADLIDSTLEVFRDSRMLNFEVRH